MANYIGIWAMFYINITCGLALISQEKMIVKCIGLAGVVGIISTVSAIFNAGGAPWIFRMGGYDERQEYHIQINLCTLHCIYCIGNGDRRY